MRTVRMALIALFAPVYVGCVFSPQTVTLLPKLSMPLPVIGGGKVVSVEVVDERSTRSLGRRGRGVAEITTDQVVADVVHRVFRDALAEAGFVLTPDGAGRQERSSLPPPQ